MFPQFSRLGKFLSTDRTDMVMFIICVFLELLVGQEVLLAQVTMEHVKPTLKQETKLLLKLERCRIDFFAIYIITFLQKIICDLMQGMLL